MNTVHPCLFCDNADESCDPVLILQEGVAQTSQKRSLNLNDLDDFQHLEQPGSTSAVSPAWQKTMRHMTPDFNKFNNSDGNKIV